VKLKKDCCYDAAQKRGRMSTSEHNPPYPTFTVQQVISAPAEHSTVNPMHELDLTNQAEESRIHEMMQDAYYDPDILEKPKNQVDLAIILAVRACSCRITDMNLAKSNFEKSKVLVMSKFDYSIQDMKMATCFALLGAFCVLEDDMERASFFMDLVRKYIDKHDIEDTSLDYLRAIIVSIERLVQVDTDMEYAIKATIVQHHSLREHLKRVDNRTIVSNAFISALAALDFSDVAQIISDFRFNTNEYELNGDRLAMISAKMSKYAQNIMGLLPIEVVQMLQDNMIRMFHGVQLQSYLRSDNMHMALTIAQAIARMVKQPIFEHTSVSFGSIMVLAANAHMQYLNRLSHDQNMRSNVLDCMQLEVKALHTIQESHKTVGARCRPIVQKLTSILRSIQESVITNNRFSTYFNVNSFGGMLSIEQGTADTLDIIDVQANDGFYELVELDSTSNNENNQQVDVIDQFFQDFM
jgi:hypothetical protein